ncbi:hypothetical protein FRC17_010497 [Serendipita sp. 399]|nr:hypothetical protein FRC17_010497 [Serendipita sp. 399]
MAQPVLDADSPLDDYLRENELDLMPGIVPEFLEVADSQTELPEWILSFVPTLCQSLDALFSAPANHTAARHFAERFKYIIISSSLLSATLSPTLTTASNISKSETPSALDEVNHQLTTPALLLFIVSPIALASGHWISSLLAFLAALFLREPLSSHQDTKVPQSRLTFDVLQHLVDTDSAWESAIGEAMELLRRDEASALGPSIQWQTPLRVALQSSLQAITTQADRVRQLFSPLANPTELAQMTEMYAPPSPTTTHHSIASPNPIRKSVSSSKLDKRITWSGALSKTPAGRSPATPNTPESPIPPVPQLPSPGTPFGVEDTPFGTLTLDLERSNRAYQRYSFASPRSLRSLRTSPSGSKFTTLQSMRNPLSTNSLDAALHAALSSKRFACAHLLALRFDEGEDDLYWEDVRSVIGLFSSSLEDETSRLSEAMDEWHRSRQRDARPSVNSTPIPASPTPLPPRKRQDTLSFAPRSSDMAKFTSHMDAITGALNRAFDELEKCVGALRLREASVPLEEEVGAEHSEFASRTALESYDTLRRELGLALRECERARCPLSLVMDNSTGSSSDQEVVYSPPDQQEAITPERKDDSFLLESPTRAGAGSPPPAYVSRGPSQIVDDVTAHLLAGATAMHLPPLGMDRVFEAESGPVVKPFRRERSTLSRQERIALAQVKRKSTQLQNISSSPLGDSHKQNHPTVVSSELMQELKEVIHRVNERKQRMVLPSAHSEPQLRSDSLSKLAFDSPDAPFRTQTKEQNSILS